MKYLYTLLGLGAPALFIYISGGDPLVRGFAAGMASMWGVAIACVIYNSPGWKE